MKNKMMLRMNLNQLLMHLRKKVLWKLKREETWSMKLKKLKNKPKKLEKERECLE